jgi:hypothetical protein
MFSLSYFILFYFLFLGIDIAWSDLTKAGKYYLVETFVFTLKHCHHLHGIFQNSTAGKLGKRQNCAVHQRATGSI